MSLCCPSGFTGLLPLADCLGYYVCSNGVLSSTESTLCEDGSMFDMSLKSCSDSLQVCEMPDSSVVACPKQAPAINQDEICCPDGYTGSRPYNQCTQYYQCQAGMPATTPIEVFDCPTGLLLDESVGLCNFAANVDCRPDACAPTVAPSMAPSSSTAAPTLNPTSSTAAPTRTGICCPPTGTVFRPYPGCNDYYLCSNGVLQADSSNRFSCQPGFLFDPTIQNCNFAARVTCRDDPCAPTVAPSPAPTPSTTAPTAPPTRSAAPTVAGLCCDVGETRFKAFDDCRQYYQCINGFVDRTFACSEGLLFDQTIQQCNLERAVDCKVDPCAPTVPPTPNPTTNVPSASPSTPYPTLPLPTTSPAPTQTPVPSTVGTTAAPTAAPTVRERCCPEGFTGFRPYNNCEQYYVCRADGSIGVTLTCRADYLFDASVGDCIPRSRFALPCEIDLCGFPTRAPNSTPYPTRSDSMPGGPPKTRQPVVDSSQYTIAPIPAPVSLPPTPQPTRTPTLTPTPQPTTASPTLTPTINITAMRFESAAALASTNSLIVVLVYGSVLVLWLGCGL